MILIVGLGNPGEKYKKTRHNLGFRIVDKIAANFQFSIFNFQSIFNAQISKGIIENQKIILAKPQTFMNNSGGSVKKLVLSYKLQVTKIWVIHDDIDLPLGKIKIIKNRGAAGHKGVESIIHELKAKNFIRFRIGVRPEKGKPKNVEKFVLQKFTKNEEGIIKEVINKTCEAIEMATQQGVEKAMNKFNK